MHVNILEQDHDAAIKTHKSKMHEYHAAIGRLMLKWVQSEELLYKVLLHYGNLSDAVGRALLSGTRARDLMNYLLAVAENTDMDAARVGDLKFVFAQLAAINTMRDRIVHHGMWSFMSVNEDYTQPITNIDRSSRGRTNMFYVHIGSDGIDSMVSDLLAISSHLSRHLQKDFVPYRKKADSKTWLYKPPQPRVRKAPSGKAARKQPNQLGPSRE
jgi:hypothetical protein